MPYIFKALGIRAHHFNSAQYLEISTVKSGCWRENLRSIDPAQFYIKIVAIIYSEFAQALAPLPGVCWRRRNHRS